MAVTKTISDYIVETLGNEVVLEDGTKISGSEAVSSWLFSQITTNSKYAMDAVKIILAYSEGAPKPEGKLGENNSRAIAPLPIIYASTKPMKKVGDGKK